MPGPVPPPTKCASPQDARFPSLARLAGYKGPSRRKQRQSFCSRNFQREPFEGAGHLPDPTGPHLGHPRALRPTASLTLALPGALLLNHQHRGFRGASRALPSRTPCAVALPGGTHPSLTPYWPVVPSHPPPPGSEARGLQAMSGSFGLRVKSEPLSSLTPWHPTPAMSVPGPLGRRLRLSLRQADSSAEEAEAGSAPAGGQRGRALGRGPRPRPAQDSRSQPSTGARPACVAEGRRGASRCPRPAWGLGACRFWLLWPLSRFAKVRQPVTPFHSRVGCRASPGPGPLCPGRAALGWMLCPDSPPGASASPLAHPTWVLGESQEGGGTAPTARIAVRLACDTSPPKALKCGKSRCAEPVSSPSNVGLPVGQGSGGHSLSRAVGGSCGQRPASVPWRTAVLCLLQS